MGSRRPDTARTTLQRNSKMKLLSELLNLSSWNSTTGSLELGKKDFHAKYTVKEQLGKGGFGVVYSAVRRSDGLEVAVKEVSKDQSAQTKSSAVAFEENALFQQISLPRLLLFLLLLLFLPLFHCDRVINNQNLILFKHIYVLSINLRQCHVKP